MILGGADRICFVVAAGKSDILEYYGGYRCGADVCSRCRVVAVHGFPLDWNHWQINEWPDRLAEVRAITSLRNSGA